MDEKKELSRHEILVIKACKNHFKNDVFSGYEAAELIIQKFVYAHPRRIEPLQMIEYLRGILLKVRKYSVEQWEERTLFLLRGAATRIHIEKDNFFERFLCLHFAEIQNLRVQSGDEVLIVLDISPEEKAEVENMLRVEIEERETGTGIRLGEWTEVPRKSKS